MHILKFYLVNTGNRHFITSNESATGEPLTMLEGGLSVILQIRSMSPAF